MIRRILKLIVACMVVFPFPIFGNPVVLGMKISESDQVFIESKYDIIHLATISNVRKTIYELNVDQVESGTTYTNNKLLEVAVYFDENSTLSDVHLVYESWDFLLATDALNTHFGKTPQNYAAYGKQSIIYHWPTYSVICFTDSASGFTHVIFSARGNK